MLLLASLLTCNSIAGDDIRLHREPSFLPSPCLRVIQLKHFSPLSYTTLRPQAFFLAGAPSKAALPKLVFLIFPPSMPDFRSRPVLGTRRTWRLAEVRGVWAPRPASWASSSHLFGVRTLRNCRIVACEHAAEMGSSKAQAGAVRLRSSRMAERVTPPKALCGARDLTLGTPLKVRKAAELHTFGASCPVRREPSRYDMRVRRSQRDSPDMQHHAAQTMSSLLQGTSRELPPPALLGDSDRPLNTLKPTLHSSASPPRVRTMSESAR